MIFKVQKKFKNAEQIEMQCHDHFKKSRVANNREFFEVPLKEIKEYIDSIQCQQNISKIKDIYN